MNQMEKGLAEFNRYFLLPLFLMFSLTCLIMVTILLWSTLIAPVFLPPIAVIGLIILVIGLSIGIPYSNLFDKKENK